MRHEDDQEHRRRAAREAAVLLLDHREALQPPPGAAEASWLVLQRRIAAGEAGPLADDDDPRVEPRRRWRGLVIGGLAVAAALALWQLSPRALVRGDSDRGGLAAIFQRVDPDGAHRASARRIVTPVPRDSSTPAPRPSTEAPPVAPAPAPVPSPVPRDRPAADLAAQLAHLHGIAEALRSGDGPTALAQSDAYLRLHPTGAFAPEARLHQAEALCLLGRGDEARAAAAAFARDLPSSPLGPRITAVCPEPTPEEPSGRGRR